MTLMQDPRAVATAPNPILPLSNRPVWPLIELRDPKRPGGFQEVWYLKLNDPATHRALWLRFTLLASDNGFKRVAETWAIYFKRGENREVTKLALKQSYDISQFSARDWREPAAGPVQPGFLYDDPGVLKIGDCEFSATRTRGQITSKGKTLKWDLAITPAQPASFNFVPEGLARFGLVKNRATTPAEDLRFSGTSEIDGETHTWTMAPGMQGHLNGPRNGHSWVWGHCNSFVNEQGQPVSFVFDGLSAKARLGPISTPQLSGLYFHYQGQEYRFNTVLDALRLRSEHSLTEWKFEAERGDVIFRGTAKAEHRDFAGVTYEDTDGSLLYCANSKLSEMRVHVYRRGKLETTLQSNGSAAFEVVSREKNPYVPLLL